MIWMRAAVVLSVMLLARPAWADDKDEKKGKGKGKGEAKPALVQIDLSKLPPDLAKQLLKYAAAGDSKPEKGPPPKMKEAPKAPEPKKKEKDKPTKVEPPKGPPAGKGKAPQVQLPPGLAKKPANHPGVVHFLQHAAAQQPAKQPAKKGKD
jgi:hypothetical protein